MGNELRDGNKILNSHNKSFLKNCNVFVIISKTTKKRTTKNDTDSTEYNDMRNLPVYYS